MNEKNIEIAKTFYTAMAAKNVADMEKYLHPEVQFIGPLAKMTGKETYLDAAKKFTTFFNTLTIRTACGCEDQVMLVYDWEFPAPIGNLPSAALLTLQQELITKIELFYDARPFDSKKAEIFS